MLPVTQNVCASFVCIIVLTYIASLILYKDIILGTSNLLLNLSMPLPPRPRRNIVFRTSCRIPSCCGPFSLQIFLGCLYALNYSTGRDQRSQNIYNWVYKSTASAILVSHNERLLIVAAANLRHLCQIVQSCKVNSSFHKAFSSLHINSWKGS